MSMGRWITGSLLVLLVVVGGSPGLASAQTTVQGQIIIQEATPSQTTPAPPPPGYGTPPPQTGYVVATPPQQAQPQCPAGSQLMPDRRGTLRCMAEMETHRVSGGLLGGGIGLLAGGWVLEIVTTLVTTVGGAIGCAVSAGCSWITSGNFDTYSWSGYVPLIGPWIQMATLWNNADGGMYGWLAAEGLIQLGGLTMIIFGAIGEDSVEWQPVAGLDIQFAPMLSGTTQGVSATARF